MKRIFELSILTFKEGVRDRALAGILIIIVLMLFITILVTSLFGHELGKVLVDLNLSALAFAGLLMTFFVNINLIAKDIDKRTIYCVLSKPLSRTEYILGKYLGLMMLVFVSLSLLMLISSGVVAVQKAIHSPEYFKDFYWGCFLQAYFYEILMFMILNAVVVFFSSITTSSFITLLFSVATYITGQTVEEIIKFFQNEATVTQMPSKFHQMIITAAEYVFPNFSAFDIKILSSHGTLMSFAHTITITGYSFIYTAFLLFFAALIFSKREFN